MIYFDVLLYFFIGYTYVCWVRYKEGAGFSVNDLIVDMIGETWFGVILLWPLGMLLHFGIFIYDRYDFVGVVITKLSPNNFYQQGVRDNDIDKQAEKHLLGGK